MKELEPIQAVIKTMMILETLAQNDEVGVTELAKKVLGNKSTVYRFLNTLMDLGYVKQNPETEQYSLTLKMYETGSIALERLDIRKAAQFTMEELAKSTKETIHLAVLDEQNLVYLHKINSTQSLKVTMMSKVGTTGPLYCTGVGKVLLAYQPEKIIKDLISGKKFERFTDSTITDEKSLLDELDKIRKEGYAIDDEEHEVGVVCVAVPIFGKEKNILASLSISAPQVRMHSDRIEEIALLAKKAALKVSEAIGYSEK